MIARALVTALCGAAVVSVTTAATSAMACSVSSEYVRPTNFELVQLADAIVVARAISASGDADDYSVRFEVRQVMKGEAPQSFEGFGALGRVGPSDRNTLGEPHPEAFMGPCVRSTFRRGGDYVIFMQRDRSGVLSPVRYPFARVNEDYGGENSLWVKTIRRYLDIQSEPDPMVELAMLAELRDGLGASAADQALAGDIADHLASRSPYKPTAYLVETLAALRRGEAVAGGVRSPEADREQSEAQALTDLIFDDAPGPFDRDAQIDFILRALVTGDHPDAAPVFEDLLANPSRTSADLGLAIRFFAKNSDYRRAFGLIEMDVMRLLPALPPDERSALLGAVLSAQRGDSYEEGQERWRSEPYVAAVWPELALSLYWSEANPDGFSEIAFGGALEAIPVSDYRARPMVTLARPFDDDALAWAFAELRTPPAPVEVDVNLDLLPLALLVRSYGDDRNAVLDAAFCSGGDRRLALIAMLGDWGGILDEDYLARLIVSPGLSEEDQTALIDAVAALHVRRRGGSLWGRRGGWFAADGRETRELLGLLFRDADDRERNGSTPIRCT